MRGISDIISLDSICSRLMTNRVHSTDNVMDGPSRTLNSACVQSRRAEAVYTGVALGAGT